MTEQQMFRLIETKTTPIKILKSQKNVVKTLLF